METKAYDMSNGNETSEKKDAYLQRLREKICQINVWFALLLACHQVKSKVKVDIMMT